MSFIRVKKIAQYQYAYLVENYWTSKGSRQKTKQYLGRVLPLLPTREIVYNLPKVSYPHIIRYLAEQELLKHGFTKNTHFTKEKVLVDLEKASFVVKKKPVVLKMNEGYLCAHTYNEACSYIPKKRDFGEELALLIVATGIHMPPELFIAVYEAAKKNINKPNED